MAGWNHYADGLNKMQPQFSNKKDYFPPRMTRQNSKMILENARDIIESPSIKKKFRGAIGQISDSAKRIVYAREKYKNI